ncbi:MAG TPA: zinc-ribbon domain-containing protein, partial [Ktedonobacterales bacterium]
MQVGVCPNCGDLVPASATICSACGAQLSPDRPPAPEQAAGPAASRRRISRRAALVGLGLVGLAAIGGGNLWRAIIRQTRAPAAPASATAAPTEPAVAPLLIYRGPSMMVTGVAWSHDGRRIASISGVQIQVWDAATGKTLLTYGNHTAIVDALAWSPDDSRIVSVGDDQTVQIWDTTSGKVLEHYRDTA